MWMARKRNTPLVHWTFSAHAPQRLRSANKFLLTASDGSSWEVHNNNAVDLTSHLGHTIKVKGVVSNSKMHNMKEDAKGAAADTGMKKNNAEHGHLKVADVDMVSESCQQ